MPAQKRRRLLAASKHGSDQIVGATVTWSGVGRPYWWLSNLSYAGLFVASGVRVGADAVGMGSSSSTAGVRAGTSRDLMSMTMEGVGFGRE